MEPTITSTITCVQCGAPITGGADGYLVRCPHCGVEYQVSISAVVVSPTDVEEKIRKLADCVIEGNPRERSEASLELAKIKDRRVLRPAIETYKKLYHKLVVDTDNYLKQRPVFDTLCGIIANTADRAATGILVEALKDSDSIIRSNAAKALEQIADPMSIEALIEAASNPADDMRWAYFDALGNLKDPRIPGLLVSALGDRSYYVKSSALRSLGKQRYAGALKQITAILEDTSNRKRDGSASWGMVRMWAAWALGDIGDDSSAKPLLQALKDRDKEVFKAVCAALRDILRKTDDVSVKDTITKAFKKYSIVL